MYQSKYYTCEEIDERLLKGYYDDAVLKGYSGSLDQMKASLASENYIDLGIVYPGQAFTFSTAVEKVTSLVNPLNKGFRFSYVDTDYSDGVYLTFEYTGDTTTQPWVCIGDLVVTTNFVDTIPTDLTMARAIVRGKLPFRWVINKGSFQMGLIDILGDSMGHQITQILTTHCIRNGVLDWSTHDDLHIYKYYRSYNVNSPHSPVKKGTWTDWAIVDKPLNEVGDSFLDTLSQNFITKAITLGYNGDAKIFENPILPTDVYKVKDNEEYLEVHTDSKGRVLWAIRNDGSVYFGVGTPPQIKESVQEVYDKLYNWVDNRFDSLELNDTTETTIQKNQINMSLDEIRSSSSESETYNLATFQLYGATSEKAGLMTSAQVDSLQELQGEVFPLSINLNLESALLELTKTPTEYENISGEYSILRKNQPVTTITSGRINSDGKGVVITKGSGIFQISISSRLGTHIVILTVTAQGLTKSQSASIELVMPMYFGFATIEDMVNYDYTQLTKQTLKSSPAGNYSLTNSTTGKYLWLCVGQNKTIKKVTSSGFEVPMETVIKAPSKIQGVYVNIYRSSNAIAAGVMNITIE